ncbi:S-layer homology domain-containing protein [Paenibacillus agaridevorans]|uniref:S-layer homology domain-containing protein n=1 Tax=Paenibacillus agaridevorans TaxID=171404 RepID=UPI000D58DBAD
MFEEKDIAKLCFAALNLKGNGGSFIFYDSDKIGVWAQPAIALAVKAGLIHGYTDGSFRPKEKLSRMEQATLLSRASRLIGSYEANLPHAVLSERGDVPERGISYVSFVTEQHVMEWRGDNRFEPQAAVTRAEAIVSLLTLIEYHRQPVNGNEGPYIDRLA